MPARGSWLRIGWRGDLGAGSFPPCAPACDSGCPFSPLSPLKYQIQPSLLPGLADHLADSVSAEDRALRLARDIAQVRGGA